MPGNPVEPAVLLKQGAGLPEMKGDSRPLALPGQALHPLIPAHPGFWAGLSAGRYLLNLLGEPWGKLYGPQQRLTEDALMGA